MSDALCDRVARQLLGKALGHIDEPAQAGAAMRPLLVAPIGLLFFVAAAAAHAAAAARQKKPRCWQ